MYMKSEKYPLKIVEGVNYTNSTPLSERKLSKITKYKGPKFHQIYFFISTPYAHTYYVDKVYGRF